MLVMLTLTIRPATAVEFSVGTGLQYFDYQEFSTSGESLNHETGLLPGVSLSAQQAAFGLLHSLVATGWKGGVDYNGKTQAGTPLRTETEQEIFALDYRADWLPKQSPGGLFARIGWQNWDRDIQPANGISGLFERYRWWTLEAGLSLDVLRTDQRSAFIELSGLLMPDATVAVDLTQFGFGEPQLDLGTGSGLAVRAGWRERIGKRGELTLLVDYRRWDFDRSEEKTLSNGSNTITIAEPESVAKNAGLRIIYAHRFGATTAQ